MTEQAEIENDDLDLDLDQEQDELDTEAQEDEVEAEGAETETDDEVDSELSDEQKEEFENIIISIEGESPPQEDEEKAPGWVRDLRKAHRQAQKENKELKAKLDEVTGAAKAVELGEKPTLESTGYDESAYEQKLADWYDRKREFDAKQAEIEAEQKKAEEAYLERVNNYEERKQKLKLSDFEDAENFVADNFSETQQGMIVNGADDAAVLVYALGKNQKLAKEISSIKDPVKFAFAVAKLETKLKVTNRKAKTKPEKKITGSGDSSGAVDSHLERLRAEASKTGDFSKVSAYKRKLKARQKT